jgi:glycerophosphoryl diester phosphodiesterase
VTVVIAHRGASRAYPENTIAAFRAAVALGADGVEFDVRATADGHLAIHHDQATGVVVLEYASQGRAVPTGAAYGNRYISVLSIVDRKIVHWRDYLDPLAVFDAMGWPAGSGQPASLRPTDW